VGAEPWRTPGQSNIGLSQYFVEFPFFGDSRMIVGRYHVSPETPYHLDGGTPFAPAGTFYTNDWLHDRTVEAIGVRKNFGLGEVFVHLGHPSLARTTDAGVVHEYANVSGLRGWEAYGYGKFQFTEQLGFDAGIQAFFGDDTTTRVTLPGGGGATVDVDFKHLWTIFAGLRFNFTDNIALRGMYYYQDATVESAADGSAIYDDTASAFRVHVDIGQDLFKFTSLWLEYNKIQQGFWMLTGSASIFNDYDFGNVSGGSRILTGGTGGNVFRTDVDLFRVAAAQRWTDRWGTYLFWTRYMVDNPDANFDQYGVGVSYQLNPATVFVLTYSALSYDDIFNENNESYIRLRTQVSF